MNFYEINEFDERRASRPELNSLLSSLSYLSIENPDLRNTCPRTVEPPRAHDPKSPRDFVKGGTICPRKLRGAGEVIASAPMCRKKG